MKQTDLTETEVASETVFQGKLLRVKRDTVSLHDGKAATREYIEHNGAVMIIPVLDTGDLVMERRPEVLAREDVLEEVVLRSATIKAKVVAVDEREDPDLAAQGRAVLNYGHTLGHALEALGIAGRLSVGRTPGVHHGEAIAIGMLFAAWLSVVLGLAGKDLVDEHVRLLGGLGLPTSLAGHRPPAWEDVRRYVGLDKKYAKGIRFVLLAEPGKPIVQGDIPQTALTEALSHITEG